MGVRHLGAARRPGVPSFVAAISVIGLMLGVAVLIVVLSVMNGFERELRTRMLAVTSHATLMGLEGSLTDWRRAAEVARLAPGVTGVAPYVEAQAMFANGSRVVGAALRGIDPQAERRAGAFAAPLRDAQLDDLQPGRWRVILGAASGIDLGAKTVTVPGRIRAITDSAVNLAQQMVRYDDYGLRYRERPADYGSFNVASHGT